MAHSLNDGDASVRDGAAIGLAALEDPRAVPFLERAATREQVSLLRSRLEEAIRELSYQQ